LHWGKLYLLFLCKKFLILCKFLRNLFLHKVIYFLPKIPNYCSGIEFFFATIVFGCVQIFFNQLLWDCANFLQWVVMLKNIITLTSGVQKLSSFCTKIFPSQRSSVVFAKIWPFMFHVRFIFCNMRQTLCMFCWHLCLHEGNNNKKIVKTFSSFSHVFLYIVFWTFGNIRNLFQKFSLGFEPGNSVLKLYLNSLSRLG
jgi:hypothetical protein